ncbi:MAG: EamA family transporter [Candidatus Moranbacteria bacterium]|nr:EamA family transporter [Candidatus Moranbacteria bacterium]
MNKVKDKLIFPPALLIALAALIWGLDGVLLRPSLHGLKPSIVVFLEHAVAFGFLVIFILLAFLVYSKKGMPQWMKQDLKSIKNLNKKGWLTIGWIALFGGLIGTLAITKALFFVGFIPLSIPILVQKIQPVFAILLARLMLKEKLRKGFLIYAGLAVLGSYLVTFGLKQPVISFDNKVLIAGLLGLLAAFAWGTSTVFGRKAVLEDLTHRSAVFLRLGITSVISFIFLLFLGLGSKLIQINDTEFNILIIIALFNAILATFLYYKGLLKVPARFATLLELIFPLTVVVGDYFLHDKILSFWQFVGAGLILFSIISLNKKIQKNLPKPGINFN